MKKHFITIIAFVAMTIGVMTLNAFTVFGKSIVSEYEYTLAANDGWKVIRENVPYCDGDNTCMGTGKVWVNTETYQVAFQADSYPGCGKMDMGEYTGKDGYNMRFWHCSLKKYCYVNIFIPSAVFN